MTLLDLILDKYEKSSKWNQCTSGNASFRFQEELYEKVDKSSLVHQAMELEKAGLLSIRWVRGYFHEDIEKVEYPLANIKSFYQLSNRQPKYAIVAEQRDMVIEYLQTIQKTWICNYIEQEVLPRLDKGNYEPDEDRMKLLFQCLSGLDKLDMPMYKRAFSKQYLNNSKIFEEKLESRIISIARKYNQEIEDNMEKQDVLSQLYIEEYSQELYLKGRLRIKVGESIIDTGCFPYGTVLNTQTIKNSVILDNPQLKKILTIENKANYTSTPFEEGTLIIFTHGYFSPLERDFLKRLEDKIAGQSVTYLHSGDMDYGGVCIFQHIKNKIFPSIKPYRMDVETFERYKCFGEPIHLDTLDKLKKLKEPLLQDLINKMIETKLVIEQEAYL